SRIFFIKKMIMLFALMLSTQSMGQSPMVVTDPGAYLEMARQFNQLVNQVEFAELQLKSIDQTLLTLDKSQYQWSDVQGVINQLGNTISQANGLSYNAANLDQEFRGLFPGYQNPANYSDFY